MNPSLNRTVLARQLLLERSELPLHRVVERMAGVQAQYAPSPYVGLWSRVSGFRRPDLTSALERRSVIQATLMRQTIHIVSRSDYWPLAESSRRQRQKNWLRAWKQHDRRHFEKLAERVRWLLADGPMKRRHILETLDIDSEQWGGVMNWVDLVRVPPSGTWESRRADLFGLATNWVGPNRSNGTEGIDLLVRRYLRGFGPADMQDIKAFTLLTGDVLSESLDRLPIRRVEGDLIDLRSGEILDGDIHAPVRFLGNWDALLLVHCRRAQILTEEYRPRIFHTRAPHSFATFLVDGQVRGTWKQEGRRVVLNRFEPIPRRFGRELSEEKAALEALLAG